MIRFWIQQLVRAAFPRIPEEQRHYSQQPHDSGLTHTPETPRSALEASENTVLCFSFPEGQHRGSPLTEQRFPRRSSLGSPPSAQSSVLRAVAKNSPLVLFPFLPALLVRSPERLPSQPTSSRSSPLAAASTPTSARLPCGWPERRTPTSPHLQPPRSARLPTQAPPPDPLACRGPEWSRMWEPCQLLTQDPFCPSFLLTEPPLLRVR